MTQVRKDMIIAGGKFSSYFKGLDNGNNYLPNINKYFQDIETSLGLPAGMAIYAGITNGSMIFKKLNKFTLSKVDSLFGCCEKPIEHWSYFLRCGYSCYWI
jgi:hypothetical protein